MSITQLRSQPGTSTAIASNTADESEEEHEQSHTKTRKVDECCLIKCFHCIKGSATYKALQLELSPEGLNSVSRIDQASRLLFPVAFFGFHVFYWCTYLNKEAVAGMFIKK